MWAKLKTWVGQAFENESFAILLVIAVFLFMCFGGCDMRVQIRTEMKIESGVKDGGS